MSTDTLTRIAQLHAWYARNVLPMRLTPEVERLWFEWLKAGYNGHDLRDVIRYIRKQISFSKRNEGALKLSNLLARSEGGFLRFDEDLGLARARGNLNVDKRLEPAPDGSATSHDTRPAGVSENKARSVSDPAAAQRALEEFRKAKGKL